MTTQQPARRTQLLQAGIDAFAQPEIREKILFTLGMLLVFRLAAHIPLPNVDPDRLRETFENNAILGFLNIFSGGALRNLSVAALGVYPYITASIIMQMAVPLIPRLQALSQEGESGRQRIQIYTHWIAVPLSFVQGYAQLQLIQQLGGISNIGFTGGAALSTFAALSSMVAGTMFLVWIGELISERGIGNGVSLIIFAGIVAGMPSLLGGGLLGGATQAITGFVLLAFIAVILVASIVLVGEAQRRVPVQYARSTFRGGRMYRQQGQTHIPLRVNSAGMVPLIFAFSIMIFPPVFAQFVATTVDVSWIASVARFIQTWLAPTAAPYWIMVFLLVMVFSFFYTLVVFQQQNLAENLQRQGGFIPGIRPGRPTQEYVTRVLIRITWGGAIFLGIISVVPFLATILTSVQAVQISAAGLLIVVGVVLDTMRQLEAQMMMRNYEGLYLLMQLILLGLPGAGKGTQAQLLAQQLGLLHISTGDMFREAAAAGTELGTRAQGYMSRGELVPDEVTINMLLERVRKPDAAVGIMLDGFPRTIPQAEALDVALAEQDRAIDAVLYIQVPEDLLMARLTGRWSCPSCGAIYHELTSPPKESGKCDRCGNALSQRADDQPATVTNRLATNRAWTEALAEFYSKQSKLHPVDGTGEPAAVTARLLTEIESVSARSGKA